MVVEIILHEHIRSRRTPPSLCRHRCSSRCAVITIRSELLLNARRLSAIYHVGNGRNQQQNSYCPGYYPSAPPSNENAADGYQQNEYPPNGYQQDGYPQDGYSQDGYPPDGYQAAIPPSPGPDYIWSGGYWSPYGGHRAWISGY